MSVWRGRMGRLALVLGFSVKVARREAVEGGGCREGGRRTKRRKKEKETHVANSAPAMGKPAAKQAAVHDSMVTGPVVATPLGRERWPLTPSLTRA